MLWLWWSILFLHASQVFIALIEFIHFLLVISLSMNQYSHTHRKREREYISRDSNRSIRLWWYSIRLLESDDTYLLQQLSGSAPLTAVQLLWVNLIMDTLGALALATEPPHDGLMSRPPVGRDVSFITKTMWRNIIGHSIYQLAVLLAFNFAGKQILKLEGSDSTTVLNTFIFNTFVFCQVCLLNSVYYPCASNYVPIDCQSSFWFILCTLYNKKILIWSDFFLWICVTESNIS